MLRLPIWKLYTFTFCALKTIERTLPVYSVVISRQHPGSRVKVLVSIKVGFSLRYIQYNDWKYGFNYRFSFDINPTKRWQQQNTTKQYVSPTPAHQPVETTDPLQISSFSTQSGGHLRSSSSSFSTQAQSCKLSGWKTKKMYKVDQAVKEWYHLSYWMIDIQKNLVMLLHYRQ